MTAVMKILTGPPGTGKTYRAVSEAVAAVDGVLPSSREELIERHQALLNSGDVLWVTFHPSYTYEDFVEGFRPVKSATGIDYEVRSGPFLAACERCEADTPEARFRSLRPGMKLNPTTTVYEVISSEDGVVILSSAPNRSNEVAKSKEAAADWWTVKKFIDAGIKPEDLSYAGTESEERKAVARKAGVTTTLLNNSGHYRAVLDFVTTHSVSTPRPVALVIDELNRADLSRVFGELMTLLELDKRKGEPEEREVILPYSQLSLSVPATLSVIATMNTADRSLAEIDLALRRRFDFVHLDADPTMTPTKWGGVSVETWLRHRNDALAALGFADNAFGHAELMEHRLRARCDAEGWDPDTEDGQRRALADVLRTKFVPLVVDLLRVDWRQAEAVMGKRGLLEAVPLPSDVADPLDDYLGGEEAGAFVVADWWDPHASTWDSPRFADALSG